MRHVLGRTIAAAAAAIIVLAACGSDGDTSSTAPPTSTTASSTSASTPAAGGQTKLVVKNFAFGTVSGAKAGAPITVENQDDFAHTVTADDGAFDVKLDPSATATITVAKAGTYAFHCKIHASMKGALTVG
jgi:plastocyanin